MSSQSTYDGSQGYIEIRVKEIIVECIDTI